MSDRAGDSGRLPSIRSGASASLTAAPASSLHPQHPEHDPRALTAARPAEPSPSGSLPEIFRIFIARRGLVVGLTLAVASIGIAVALLETPLYRATVRIQIDRQAARIVESGGVSPLDASDSESLRTQHEVLRSRALAERVASAEASNASRISGPPSASLSRIVLTWLGASHSSAPAPADRQSHAQQAAVALAAHVLVRPVPGSRLVDIAFTDPSPERAARIANAFAEAYISHASDKRQKSSSYARAFLDDQSRQLQARLRESETAQLKFAEENQIIILGEKSTVAESNLAAANALLSASISERMRNEQVWRQVDSHKGIDLPQFLSNGVIQHLRAARKALETEYQEKAGTFRPSYPAMLEITAKLKEIDRQIAAEVRTIKASLKAAYEAALQHETETRTHIATLRAELLELQRHLIEYNGLKREADTTRSLYNGLLQRLREVEVAGAVAANSVFIVDRAEVPGTPASPGLSRAIPLWLGLGLAAGLAAAYLVELFDNKFRTPEQLARISSLATIATIPKVGRRGSATTEPILPHSPMSDAYHSLCHSWQFASILRSRGTVLIASAGPSEGRSTTALAIARSMAAVGAKVLLIDADLRHPTLHTMLKLENNLGLNDCLMGRCAPLEAMQTTDIRTLVFMASGSVTPSASALVASSQLHALLSAAREAFDITIIDAPPLLGSTEARQLASAATATIVVARAGRVSAAELRRALYELRIAQAVVIGTVLTMVDPISFSGCRKSRSHSRPDIATR